MSRPNSPYPGTPEAPVTGALFNPLDVDVDDAPIPTAPVASTGSTGSTAESPRPADTATPAAPPTGAPAAPADPAADLEPAPEAAAAETVETDEQRAARERSEQLAMYEARRRRYARLLLLVAALAVWYVKPWSGLTLPALPGAGAAIHSTSQQALPPRDVVDLDLTRIHQRLRRTGDLTGMRLPGAEVAAAGKTLYVARTIDGQCVVYGVANGADLAAQADATGQACAGQIKDVQAQLDAADAAQRADAVAGATQALTQAADTAAFYAQQHYVAGRRSLTGLPAGLLGDATVVTNHGDWAQLRAVAAGTCRTAIVAATGHLGEISPC